MQEIANQINSYSSFVIFAHINPDGDAIGSAMALSLILKKMGKEAAFCIEGDVPRKYEFLEEYGEIYNYMTLPRKEYEAAISVDVSNLERLGTMQPVFEKYENTIVIDHHGTNAGFGKVNYVESVSAAGLLIYRLAKLLNVELDINIATLLYVAICTDTGNFSYTNTDTETLLTASELKSFGVNISELIENIYHNRSFGATKLLGKVLDRISLYGNGKISITYVLQSDYVKYNASQEDTEEIINYAREIDGVEIAIFAKQIRKKEFRLSFRSKTYVDVAALAQEFQGGGHRMAAGGMIRGELDDILPKLVSAAERYL